MNSTGRRPATVFVTPRAVATCWLAMLAGGVLLTQPGCTTLLTAGGLQEAFQDVSDIPAVASYDTASDTEAIDGDESSATAEPKPTDPTAAEDALDTALERLAAAGRLTSATEDALNAAVEDAPPQDWPVIIDAFVATIEAPPAPQRTAMRPVDAPVNEPARSIAEPEASDATAEPTPKQAAGAEPVSAAASEPTPETPAATTAVLKTEATPAAEPHAGLHLAVVNPCFASRVRGWGAIDRFDTSRFRQGQELIVYFELEDLSDDESPEGHTTRIDTTLQLLADDGRQLHQWRFEPLQETCRAPRRDYFARYVVRIPDDVPAGACRLDLAVTDTVAHATAHASLPLEIAGRVQ